MTPRTVTRIRSAACAVAVALLPAGQAVAAEDACYVPPFLTEPGHSLQRAAKAALEDKKLAIVIVSGSPSQVGGTKGLRSYPTYLEKVLRDRLPEIAVTVEVRAKARQSAAEAADALPQILAETKPELVIWHTGTVDTLRQTGTAGFTESIARGITAVSQLGADIVLLDMQYSPRTDRLVDYASYLEALREASETSRVPLFDRYEIMRYWNVAGAFDLTSLRDDGLYEKIHVCLGELMADFILRGTGLREGKGIGG